MRKILPVLILMIVLQSCALAPATNTPQPTSTIFITYTLIDTPTSTFTPISAASPTIVRIPTQDFNATATVNAIPIYVGSVTATLAPNALTPPAGAGPGFAKVTVAPTKIYWGGCEANQAVINATVEDEDNTAGVIIFMRVKSATDEDFTPWTTGNVMFNNRDGTFTYIAIGSEIEGHNHYKASFIYFQLVAVDDEGKEIGRTKIYKKAISMSPCPCLTPVTGCPLPTSKP